MTPARADPSRASMVKVCRSGTRPEPRRALPVGRGALDGRLAVAACPHLLRVLRCQADLDPARLALLRLRDRHGQHAAVEPRADRVGIDALRQRKRAAEAPECALDAIPAALALRVLGLPLAA